MKSPAYSFRSRVVRISDTLQYFAAPVPPSISQALKTKGPVAVSARVNGGNAFLVSLSVLGHGRHQIRLKTSVRARAQLVEGDWAEFEIIPLGKTLGIQSPPDLRAALKRAGLTNHFKAIPIGQRRYLLRHLEQAKRDETRQKRIQAILEKAQNRQITK